MNGDFMLGEHGAEVRVPPDVAVRLAPILVRALRRARDEGQSVDGRTVAVIGAIQLASERYRRSLQASRSEPPEPGAAVLGADSAHEVTVADAAGQLGVSEGYVRRLARLGVLPGRRVAGVWILDAVAVDERRAAS